MKKKYIAKARIYTFLVRYFTIALVDILLAMCIDDFLEFLAASVIITIITAVWWFLFIRPGVYFKTDGSIIIKIKPMVAPNRLIITTGELSMLASATQVVRIGTNLRVTGLDIEVDYDNGNSDTMENNSSIGLAVLEWISYPGFSKRLDKLDTKICDYRIKLKENNQL